MFYNNSTIHIGQKNRIYDGFFTEMYCLFHALPVQACRGTTQPQANQLQEQLKSLIACVDWWKMKQLGKNQTLPTGFTDTFWQSGHMEEYYNLSFQSLAQEH